MMAHLVAVSNSRIINLTHLISAELFNAAQGKETNFIPGVRCQFAAPGPNDGYAITTTLTGPPAQVLWDVLKNWARS